MHSALRWVVLALLVVTLVKAWQNRQSSFTAGQAKLGLFTMISMHIQLLLGLALYMMKGWASMLGQPGVMESTVMRFFTVEHLVGMLLAILFGTLGHSLTKRAASDDMKHKRQLRYFGIALLLIVASVPWIRGLRLVLMMNRSRLIVAVAAAVVLAIAGCGGEDTPSQNNGSTPPSEASIKRAYTMKCSLCHGSDGKLMASKAPDLSQSTMDLESRIALITYGKGTMPPQKGILDAATIRGIAEYIETFRDVK